MVRPRLARRPSHALLFLYLLVFRGSLVGSSTTNNVSDADALEERIQSLQGMVDVLRAQMASGRADEQAYERGLCLRNNFCARSVVGNRAAPAEAECKTSIRSTKARGSDVTTLSNRSPPAPSGRKIGSARPTRETRRRA